jgi:hypothetical protein
VASTRMPTLLRLITDTKWILSDFLISMCRPLDETSGLGLVCVGLSRREAAAEAEAELMRNSTGTLRGSGVVSAICRKIFLSTVARFLKADKCV